MKSILAHIDKKEVLLHALFWLIWIAAFVVIQSLGQRAHEYFVWLMYYLITLPVFMGHTYLIAYWLVPRFFFKPKYVSFVILVFTLLVLFSVIELLVSNNLVFKVFDPSKVFSPGYLNLKNILISGLGNHYIIFVFLAIKVGRSWYLSEIRKEELLISKTETELEIYQYQLQPKLVYSLIDEVEKVITEDSQKAPDLIIKLSGFLNRFLFEGKEGMIPLQLEVKMMEEFMEIHRFALSERLKINFVVNGNLKPFVVPPLLLLPFLNDSLKIVYECNNFFETTVLIKAERKYLLFSFTIWSEDSFCVTGNDNMEITKRRLNYRFRGKHRLIENIDDNFREISLEIYF
ncbi:histidine kinase [Maribellus sp. YY47]|uniref:histidine kinase n=1 Tax=Maribellus sp. YY47 TaxID=2929486 RepID=UPI0020006CEF|nr:histidine kinase [Maribellus sp. YY47]MCK3685083.1 histidine kinase [Maribellus sp. YY47]